MKTNIFPFGSAARLLSPQITGIPTEFVVPDGMRLRDAKSRLKEEFQCAEEGERKITRTFLDSFDWRAYQAGGAVEEETVGVLHRLVWHDLSTGDTSLHQDIEQPPGFAWDLPRGDLRDRLAQVLEMRTLLPLVKVLSQIQTLRLLDSEEKTVLRLHLEENRYCAIAQDRDGPLASRVLLLPVRGYDKPLREMARRLQTELGLEPARTNLLQEALAAAGRRCGDYSSKLNYQLDPEMRADEATKHLLLGLLYTLEANIDGARANLDSEFLHDLRVATRRTRSALTQIKGVFNPEVVEDYKNGFAWVQQVTGPVRDLDVYLLTFEEYRKSLPALMRPNLEPMREFLLAQYDSERNAMVRELNARRFRALNEQWRNFLEAPVPAYSTVPNAVRPIKVVADERIWKTYRRVRREGLAIGPHSPPEEMHELRKSCKKLRYLMEFFQSLYPKNDIRGLIKILKVLLDNLGNFQDLAVQADHLRDIAQRMSEEGKAATDVLLAMGVLVGDLLKRQQQARLHFTDIFTEFDRKRNRKLFQSLFTPAARRGRAA